MLSDNDELARIFMAMYCRMLPISLEEIREADKTCAYASMNLGMNGQIEAQNDMFDTVVKAFDDMLVSDVENIKRIIEEVYE